MLSRKVGGCTWRALTLLNSIQNLQMLRNLFMQGVTKVCTCKRDTASAIILEWNLEEHRLVQRSGATSRGTALNFFFFVVIYGSLVLWGYNWNRQDLHYHVSIAFMDSRIISNLLHRRKILTKPFIGGKMTRFSKLWKILKLLNMSQRLYIVK